jgi:hypothetical protein
MILNSRLRRPFLQRLMWNPFLVALPFAYMAYAVYTRDFTIQRTLAAALTAIWFCFSVYDLTTHHRWLDWLYSDDSTPRDNKHT